MKTIYKLLLALGALLGMVALGLFWLVRGAFNVADNALDATANGVDKVVGVAQKQTAGVVQAVKAEVKDTPAAPTAAKDDENKTAASNAAPDNDKTAPANAPAADGGKNGLAAVQAATAKKPAAKKAGNEVEDDLADVGQLFKMLLSEGDDSGDGGDVAAVIPGATSKSDDGGDLTSLVPGGDSPTLRGVMAGKYKGKEGKIIDDALDDPKAWRLLFFLGGGM